jgi:hypothetical protein
MKRLALALILLGGGASAAEHHHPKSAPGTCTEIARACADKATPFFTEDGTLWLAWSANGRIGVERSIDRGKTFSPAVLANHHAEKLDAGADSRPQIVVDVSGRVVVAYAVARDANYNGQIFTASSVDGVAPFSAPQPLTDSAASQRFAAFALDPSGRVFAAWIDKRNLAAAKAEKKPYDGAALAFTWGEQGGAFAPARIALDQTCECCRIAVAFAGPNRPAVIWRNIFSGGVRDHAVMTFDGDTPGPVTRVSEDDWQIDGCPHHGPSLAISTAGTYHAVWFTEGRTRQGVFYARAPGGGKAFGPPVAIGDIEKQPSRPYLLAVGNKVWMAWKEFDGQKSQVLTKVSLDDGLTWSSARPVAETSEASDHPLLVESGGQVFLSWLTRHEGYRLVAVKEP